MHLCSLRSGFVLELSFYGNPDEAVTLFQQALDSGPGFSLSQNLNRILKSVSASTRTCCIFFASCHHIFGWTPSIKHFSLKGTF